MTHVRKNERAALLELAALPDDDWQPEHWAVYDAARAQCRDLFRRLAVEVEREAATPSQKPRGRPKPKQDPPELIEAKKAVKWRSGGNCEARIVGVCEGRATEVHHRAGRGFDGCHDPALLLHVCGRGNVSGCHGYIETHPEWAKAHALRLMWGTKAEDAPEVVVAADPDGVAT